MEGEEGEGGERYYDEEVRTGSWALVVSGVANSIKATHGACLLQVDTEPH